MKKLPFILNAVLAVAVIFLYVWVFALKPVKTNSGSVNLSNAGATGGIVYVNIDSVISNYTMRDDVVGALEQKVKTAQAEFESKQRNFQKNYEDYKYKAERQLVTRSEAAQIEQSLQQEQQQLALLQNDLQYRLAEEEQVAQRKVLNAIMEYLKGMEGAQNYQFILGNTFGGNIMYANESLDITKQVTEGLNAAYKKPAEEKK